MTDPVDGRAGAAGTADPERGAREAQRIGRILFSPYRVRVQGAELVPATGPVLLISNHQHNVDGPVVLTFAPRPVHFLVKKEAFVSVLGRALRRWGQIRIDRSTGDRAALAEAVAVLRRGGVVGIFPEGTRGGGAVDAVQQGAAWLALQGKATLVPVAVEGVLAANGGSHSRLPKPGTRLAIRYGEPFTVEAAAGVPGRERLRLASELIRTRLAAHVAGR